MVRFHLPIRPYRSSNSAIQKKLHELREGGERRCRSCFVAQTRPATKWNDPPRTFLDHWGCKPTLQSRSSKAYAKYC